MMRLILPILMTWVLLIQSYGLEAKAFAVIPVKDEATCLTAIQQIKEAHGYSYRKDDFKEGGFYNTYYSCVDTGMVD